MVAALGVGCGTAQSKEADTSASVRNGWEVHRSTPGSYQAEFPGVPQMERSEVPTRLGAVVLSSERLATIEPSPDRAEVAYSVSYFDLPGQVTVSRKQLIDIARKNFAVEAVSVLSEAEVAISGYEGRELFVDLDGVHARGVRVVPAGKRMFYVVVEGDREAVLGKKARRFLRSFAVYAGWDAHENDAFRIDVPTLSSHSVVWRQVAGMPTQYDLFDLDRGQNPPVQYFVAQTHLPAEAVTSTSPELLLRLTEAALHEGTEVVKRESVSAGNWPGRHYTVRLPDGGSGELRIVVARAELFQLGVLTPADGGIPLEGERFFSTFDTETTKKLPETLSELERTFGPPTWRGPSSIDVTQLVTPVDPAELEAEFLADMGRAAVTSALLSKYRVSNVQVH